MPATRLAMARMSPVLVSSMIASPLVAWLAADLGAERVLGHVLKGLVERELEARPVLPPPTG